MKDCIDIYEISSEHLMDYEQELEYCKLIIHLLVRKQGFGDSAYECVSDIMSICGRTDDKLYKIMNDCENRVYYFGNKDFI